jgi:hypothetical protein
MSLSFLEKFRARRVGGTAVPDLFGPVGDTADDEDNTNTVIRRNYECLEENWQAQDIALLCPRDWTWRPRRFVDGRDMGRPVAWLEDPEGFPVPLRLAQVGAAVMQAEPQPNGASRLTVEWREVMSVVALATDAFPWRDIEAFAAVLQAKGYRLVMVDRAMDLEARCDFYGLATSARVHTMRTMSALEKQMLAAANGVPTVADGLLDQKILKGWQDQPWTGVIKTHTKIPLHALGMQVLARLQPYQRTPVYERILPDIPYLTWYLRLGPNQGDPQQRVVRIEICRDFFENVVHKDFGYVDLLSRYLCDCRTRDRSYKRNAITLYPIQRTEDVIRAVFYGQEALENRFCQTLGINA